MQTCMQTCSSIDAKRSVAEIAYTYDSTELGLHYQYLLLLLRPYFLRLLAPLRTSELRHRLELLLEIVSDRTSLVSVSVNDERHEE